MKSCKKILLLVIAFVLAMNINVSAADYATAPSNPTTPTVEVTLTASATEGKVGDTFTVTISGKCEKGVSELDSIVEYDKEKLQLTKIEAHEYYMDLSGTNESTGETFLSLIYGSIIAPEEVLTEVNVAVLNFKILDTVTANESLTVKLKEIYVCDEAEGEYLVQDQNVTIKVVDGEGTGNGEGEQTPTLSSIVVTNDATKVSYKVGEKFDKSGMIVKATYSDGTSKEITNYTYSPNGKLSVEDKVITITYTEGEVTKTTTQAITVEAVKSEEEPNDPSKGQESQDTNKEEGKKDPTIANKPINNAGIEQYAILLISLTTLVAFVLYIKCKKYSDIK